MSFITRRELFKDAYEIHKRNLTLPLKFIGEDGSMCLRHGQVYECRIYSYDNYIFVEWINDGGGCGSCPYSSIEALNDNWQSV